MHHLIQHLKTAAECDVEHCPHSLPIRPKTNDVLTSENLGVHGSVSSKTHALFQFSLLTRRIDCKLPASHILH